ncbi:MAG TPA: hypothetical protein ENK10_06460 [Acidobacteria bacterium]|nr:hypothetical protein [Acidobacteriota bacterium]
MMTTKTRKARVLMVLVLLLSVLHLACYISNYPVITDDRGDYSGVIRTGHKAYIKQEYRVATVFADGSDETFSMVYQNAYGDQKIYTFNNFDPTASVIFHDDTYCDWRYEGCAVATAWNPHQDELDDPFDMRYDFDCSGARSICMMVSYGSRLGECGDRLFGFGQQQDVAAEFADLAVTQWRGESAYVLPVDTSNTTVVLTTPGGSTYTLPIYGHYDAVVTEQVDLITFARPNVKAQLQWLLNWVEKNGRRATINIEYGSVQASVEVAFEPDALRYNLTRF